STSGRRRRVGWQAPGTARPVGAVNREQACSDFRVWSPDCAVKCPHGARVTSIRMPMRSGTGPVLLKGNLLVPVLPAQRLPTDDGIVPDHHDRQSHSVVFGHQLPSRSSMSFANAGSVHASDSANAAHNDNVRPALLPCFMVPPTLGWWLVVFGF